MEDIKNIVRKLTEYNIRFEENVLLKNRTWIKTGGIASLFVTPVSVDELVEIIDIFKKENVGFEIVGHTSNLYYLDDYNPTAIVSTNKIKSFREKNNYIECECGVPTSTISRYCVEKGFTGYSGLVNLPGTVGAAICNNSSCFECSLSEHLIDATFYDLDKNEIKHLVPSDLNFTYRSSNIKMGKLNGVLLTLRLDKKQGVIKEEKTKAEEATIIRKRTQEAPAYTLGSVYAGLIPQNDILAKIAVGGGKILRLCNLYTKKRYIKFVLTLYGFSDIKDFVSEKVINTFKWLPNRNDKYEKFQRYCAFINKAYKDPKLEIEIRDGNR